MPIDYDSLVNKYSTSDAFVFLADLDLRLSGHVAQDVSIDYADVFRQLDNLLNQMKENGKEDLKAGSKPPAEAEDGQSQTAKFSRNVARLLSRNIIAVLSKLPNKVYDLANRLLSDISSEDGGNLSSGGHVACIVLIDILENFPYHLSSLINFAATTIYKILKKNPLADCKLVYLLGAVLSISQKSDVDEKFQAKLTKLFSKTLASYSISLGEEQEFSTLSSSPGFTITSAKYYVIALKHALILQASTNYQQLLEFSTSSTSGTKMKPEAIMLSQNQFQLSLLSSHEKVFYICLQSHFTEVRIAMADLIANVLNQFVATGKFNTVDYLLDLYPLPDLNLWDHSLSSKVGAQAEQTVDRRKDKNVIGHHDSEAVVLSNLNLLLLQIGCVEAFVSYIQLESLEDWEYLPSNLTQIIDSILKKFGDLVNPLHVQNDQWVHTLTHWSKVIKFLVNESGLPCQDTLARHIVQYFSVFQDETQRSDNLQTSKTSKDKKRESSLFGFKKKNKTKGNAQNDIKLYANPYQLRLALQAISILLRRGVDFESIVQNKREIGDSGEAVDEDVNELVDEDENKSTTKKYNYISELLLCLLANDSEYIRNYSLAALIEYVLLRPSEGNALSLEIFQLISQEFNQFDSPQEANIAPTDRNIARSVTKLFSYSLALSSLIKNSDVTMLQNSTIAKLLSFCTQNLKHNTAGGPKQLKLGACWIILSSLVTFHGESEFVKLNSSQFLVFWKNLLTSQFVISGLNDESSTTDMSAVIQNLKLRTLSIVCLLNYISSVEVTPETSKQLQFLLVKSQKYLVYLESNIESLGSVTSFSPQSFNEFDFNANLVNGNMFSNRFEKSNLSLENQLVSLILYNKKVLLQGFIKIAHTLKGDINSSLVVFLVKVFADVKIFSRLSLTDYGKEKSRLTKSKFAVNKISQEDKDILYLGEDYNYNFGVTSKFESCSPNIDETLFQQKNDHESSDSLQFKDPFTVCSLDYSRARIESPIISESHCWIDCFEKMKNSTPAHSVNFDPLMLLINDYSLRHKFSANLLTTLVDLSIELFQLVFTRLSYKIQFSLLEQLRSALKAKNVDPLRAKALTINISVALHGLLNNIVKKSHKLNEDLVVLVFEILDLLEVSNKSLVFILADSAGLASCLLSKSKLEEHVANVVNKIANDTSPHRRGRYLLSLAKINQHSHLAFSEVYNVVSQLIEDYHPVMLYYSLIAASIIFENGVSHQMLIENIIDSVYSNFLSDKFDYDIGNSHASNLRASFTLIDKIANLIKVSVTSLGPSLRTVHSEFKSKIFSLILSISYGIGSGNTHEYISTITSVLKTSEEILVFDSTLVAGFTAWFQNYCSLLIAGNLKTGLGFLGPTSIQATAVFPFVTSHELMLSSYSSLVEMAKIGISTLDKGALNLAWISMELRPNAELEKLITYWIDSTPEAQWFSQLTQLFNISSKKVVGKFIERQFQQKLLPLAQRQKKNTGGVGIEFTDEESQNIIKTENESDDKNQPLSWDFKLLIYELLIKLLSKSHADDKDEALEPKIQEIVRMSFMGTTAPIVAIKLKGVELLNRALEIFGDLEDPLYPGISILEQQQAQIISALIPCFSSDSDSNVISRAISVSSKFINLPRIKFYSKQRILKTMIFLLEEISSNKYLKFVFLESMAEYGRRTIQISILNCWAVLYISHTADQQGSDPEFNEILTKYSSLLISSWILAMKDLSNLKYNSLNSKELELYSSVWLNFVEVLSLILETDHGLIQSFLKEDEENFFFVMFCQCSEALIKHQNVLQVLVSVNRLVKIPGLAKTLSEHDIFGEVIDLLERLVLMEDDIAVKCKVLDTVGILFHSFTKGLDVEDQMEEENLLELLRVAMLPLFENFPFLSQNYNPADILSKVLVKNCNSADSIALLKKQLSTALQMIQGFSHSNRTVLYSCMLYLIAKFYEFGDNTLIGVTLPYLKSIVNDVQEADGGLLSSFAHVLKENGYIGSAKDKNNYIITTIILTTGAGVELGETESQDLAQILFDGLTEPDMATTSIQSIKPLIAHANHENTTVTSICKDILQSILNTLVAKSLTETEHLKIMIEVLFLFVKSQTVDTTEKATALFGLVIPLLLEYYDDQQLNEEYLHDKMMTLVRNDPESFKLVIRDQLDEKQKKTTEDLVKYNKSNDNSLKPDESIRLKSFT